jgi:hypothetical protein
MKNNADAKPSRTCNDRHISVIVNQITWWADVGSTTLSLFLLVADCLSAHHRSEEVIVAVA